MSENTKKPGLFGRLFGRAKPSPPEGPTEAPATPVAAVEVAPSPELPESQREPEHAATLATEPASPPVVGTASAAPAEPVSWFQRLKAGLTRTSSKLSDGIANVFVRRKLDASTLEELEDLLLQSDLGVETASRISSALSKGRYEKGISADEVRGVVASEISKILAPVARPLVLDEARRPHVMLVVGVNGTGKTTTIGKLAAWAIRDDKKVMIAAGDTFRAAAIDQLRIWGERTGASVIAREVGADASGLAFDALTAARDGGFDVLIIDTAGRLQNKQGLMQELEKVVRVIKKVDPSAPHDCILVLDATTGQNAIGQVEVFSERAGVTGLIMTKLDGTARGGILVAIAAKFGLPVHAIGVGESVDDLQAFDADEFARAIALG